MRNGALEYVEFNLNAHRYFREKGQKIHGDPTPVYEFMMKHGREWEGAYKPDRYVWRTPNWCFANSWRFSLKSPHMVYCEGYADSGFIPVHHAWCVDRRTGEIVDTTWRPEDRPVEHQDPMKWCYFGVPFDSVLLNGWMKSKTLWGVLFELRYNEPYFGIGLTEKEIIAKVAA